MKRIFLSLICVLVSLSAIAQTGLGANQRVIGYTVSDEWDYEGVMFGAAGTYPIGALMYPESIDSYKGCKVVGMRVAVSMDLGRTDMFVYDLNQGQLFNQKQRLYQGWNNIFFNGDGYTLTGEESLFFGYNYVETADMVKDEVGGICCMQNTTSGGFMILQGNSLYPISGAGDLCVQLILDVSNLPKKNMAVTLMDTGFKYKKANEEIDLFCLVNNTGRDSISNYTMEVRYDNLEPKSYTIEKSLAPGATDAWEEYIAIPSDLKIGAHTVTARIAAIEGEPVENDPKKERSASFAIYERSLDRNMVFCEVYSDQNNALSPYTDAAMAYAKENMKEFFNLVQVHAPGTTLAVPGAEWLHNIYAYTTPSFTSNRSYFPGENYIAYDLNQLAGLLPDDMLGSCVEEIVAQDLFFPSFASLDLEGAYDAETRKLTLTASGEVLPEALEIYKGMGITLMVVEDEVKAAQYEISALTGRGKNNPNYIHNNVLRGFITAPVGDKVEVKDGKYSVSYTYTLPAEFNPSKVRVAAILSKTADDITLANAKEYDVTNAALYAIGDVTGVSDVMIETEKEVEGIYTLDGLRLSKDAALAPGLHIIRYTDGSSKKVYVK